MIKPMLVSCIGLTLILVCGSSLASNGIQLMEGVKANEKIDQGQTPPYQDAVKWGYLTGVLRATIGIMTNTGGICPPSGISKGQGLKIVSNWLTNHPDRLQEPDYVLVAVALAETFPCSK